MTDQKVSIIIPCYNCSKTLEEAVAPCFTQGLVNFEIIMVDDGSTDGTRTVMEKIAKKHREAKILFHEKNKGGGAARNTGIRASTGELIYCLDSDNFFGKGSLAKMAQFVATAGIDGAIFSEQRFFLGSNPTSYEAKISQTPRAVSLEDLFGDTGIVVDNFLMTRASFDKTAGFPEHHGFDTQGFEVRYLSAGSQILACPNTVFYHRLAPSQPSYFERVYNNGELSINYYLIFEEILDLLSDEARTLLLSFDIFQKSSTTENLVDEIKRLSKQGKLLKKEGANISPENLEYEDVVTKYRAGAYTDAMKSITNMLASGNKTKTLFYTGVRSQLGIAGTPRQDIEREARKLLSGFIGHRHTLYKKYHRFLLGRIAAHLARVMRDLFKKQP